MCEHKEIPTVDNPLLLNNRLDDKISNEGAFSSDRKTDQGNTPSDDLLCYKVSPGKAFVHGWEVNRNGTTILDVTKPRDKQVLSSANVPFSVGNLLRVNNVAGTPFIGINNNANVVELHHFRKSAWNPTGAPAGSTIIGRARVYSFGVTDAAYSNESTSWDLYLFDIQTYTDLTVNTAVTLNTPTFVQGQSSGATGYLRNSVSAGTAFTCYDVKGEFFVGENLHFNGVSDNNVFLVEPSDNAKHLLHIIKHTNSYIYLWEERNQNIFSLYKLVMVLGLEFNMRSQI